MVGDLLAALKEQRQGIPAPGARWGWKAPRTIFVLPAIHHVFRDSYAIQLVRDGRDMAYSQNQNQLEALGPALLGDLDPDTPQPVRSIALWSRVNVAAAAYGRRFMEGRHLVIRYEDLCAEPERTIARLLAHLEADPDPAVARAQRAGRAVARDRALAPATIMRSSRRSSRPAPRASPSSGTRRPSEATPSLAGAGWRP